MTNEIYHNARCSKSRATLAILEQNFCEFEVVNYLETPPDREELKALLSDLGITARELMRKGEAVFKEKDLANPSLSEEQLIEAMIATPILIERPIVRTEQGVVIGRPPENVLSIL